MKKTTQKKHSNKLTNRLLKYSALSIAMAGVADASGQIVYTDVDPDLTNGGGGTSDFIDLNNDGTNDFVIGTTAAAIGLNGVNPTDAWVGSQGAYLYPFAFDNGEAISSGLTGWYSGDMNIGTLNYASCYSGVGASNWCGVTDKYLGLRFQIAGNIHYGWARLDVTLPADSFTLKDYAYNTTPDQPINAGQMSLSIDEFEANKTKIVALNKSIGLYNLTESSEFKVFDLTGKAVIQGAVATDTHVIEANSLSNGIYIVELRDLNSGATMRQKIVL